MRLTVNPLMKLAHLTLVITACYLVGCTPATIDKTEPPPLSMGAWITYWDYERGFSALEQSLHVFDDVFFFSWALDSAGNPILVKKNIDDIQRTIALLKRARIRSWLTVVNDVHYSTGRNVLKDSETVHQLLIDGEKRRSHLTKLLQLAQSYGFDGIDIDYENLHPKSRKQFTRFIRELAAELKRHNLKLSVTVQPKRGDSRSLGPGAMDWSALCRHVDRLQIMLYNLHNKHTDEGGDQVYVKQIVQVEHACKIRGAE